MTDDAQAPAPLVLTVCVGNLHRSPLAERLLQARLGDAARVRSVGTRATDGDPLPDVTAAEVVRLGGSPEGFAARRATAAELGRAALVLTMTRRLRTDVLALQPAALRRTFTLPELAAILTSWPDAPSDLAALVAGASRRRPDGAAAADVDDPVGRDDDVHRRVADVVAGHVDVVAPVLLRAVRGSAGP